MKLFLLLINFAFCFASAGDQISYVSFKDVFKPELSFDAIVRDEEGFENDFLLLHSVIREYQPKNIFEIGTCEGKGTLIVKNAIREGIVYTLELPAGEGPYNISADRIGVKCTLPFVQLIGDSMTFDYSTYFPIDAWFIDGWHDYEHVYYETEQAILSDPKLLVWHDSDVQEVFQAIIDVMQYHPNYIIFRVVDTRVTYAVKI